MSEILERRKFDGIFWNDFYDEGLEDFIFFKK